MHGKGFRAVPTDGHTHEQHMNGITNRDDEYQEIIRRSDEYSGKLEKMNLPKEIRLSGTVLGEDACRSKRSVLKKQ